MVGEQIIQQPADDGNHEEVSAGESGVSSMAAAGEGLAKSSKACEGREAASAVSKLQEYIQSCSMLSPHGVKILTWSFDQESEPALLFRATVSFVFNNVPHHFCGGWQTSKKKAQRDTAERVRHYLSRGVQTPQEGVVAAAASSASSALSADASSIGQGRRGSMQAPDPNSLPEAVAEELWRVFQGGDPEAEKQGLLSWATEERKGAKGNEASSLRATVNFSILNVPHQFAGCWCHDSSAAHRDVAERVLWYFGRLAKGCFCATSATAAAATAAAGPPFQLGAPGGSSGSHGDGTGECGDGGNGDDKQSVEDKMVLMQVHNALQKNFAKDAQPGERVWLMSYESDAKDLQLFRAIIKVPSWDKTFYGDWCRGKKLAQRSACLVVKDELIQRPPRPAA